jgi:steroid delta-isomerase-like uncharacterized protein
MSHRHPRWVLVLLGVAAAACTGRTDATLDRHKMIAQRVFDEVLNQGRYELFAEAYDTGFVKHVDGRSYRREDEIAQAKATRAVASDLVMTVDHMIAEGDRVAVQYTGRGTQDGAWGQVPPTGKPFVLSGVTVYRFAADRIVEEWSYYNELDALRQLELAPGGR